MTRIMDRDYSMTRGDAWTEEARAAAAKARSKGEGANREREALAREASEHYGPGTLGNKKEHERLRRESYLKGGGKAENYKPR